MAFVVRDVVDKDFVVVPPILVREWVTHFRQRQQFDIDAWRGVDGYHFEARAPRLVRPGVSLEKRRRRAHRSRQSFESAQLGLVEDVAGKYENPPRAITREKFLEVPRPGARLVQDFVAGHSHANLDLRCKMRLRDDPGWTIVAFTLCMDFPPCALWIFRARRLDNNQVLVIIYRDATSEEISLIKNLLEGDGIDRLFIEDILAWSAGKQAREFMVKVDQLLGDLLPFRVVGVQE